MTAFFGDGVFWGASAAATVVRNRTSEVARTETMAIQRRMIHRYPHRRSAQPPIAQETRVKRTGGLCSECRRGQPWLEVSPESVKVVFKSSLKSAGFPLRLLKPFLK